MTNGYVRINSRIESEFSPSKWSPNETASPIEEHQEVFDLLAEALPGLDKVLVEELATDYLLETLVCIGPWDFNHVLIRPGPFVTGAETVASVDDLPAQAEQLMDDLLAARSTKLPPSGMLMVVTSPPTLGFRKFSEFFSRLEAKLPGKGKSAAQHSTA